MLEIKNLTVKVKNDTPILTDVSLSIDEGTCIGLTGASGSGKTTLIKSIMGMNSGDLEIAQGQILLDGDNLLIHGAKERRALCGKTIGFIPQNPMTAFFPHAKMERQIIETLRMHTGLDKKQAHALAENVLRQVNLTDTKRVLSAYPGELSGGMLQRIAMALILGTKPKYVLADEPTSALDEANRDLLLELLRKYQKTAAILFISHDTEAMKALCPITHVMERGKIIETQATEQLFMVQLFVLRLASVAIMFCSILFYLQGSMTLVYCLLMCVASFLIFSELEAAGGKSFALRLIESSIDKVNAIDDTPVMDLSGKDIAPKDTMIELQNVGFSYGDHQILNHVNLTIPAKTTTAIVGPSGSGKTTLCSLITRFWDVDEGCIKLGGTDIREYKLDSLLSNISMVFQNVFLFADSIENNIKFGKPDATHEEVVRAAKSACCHDFIMALPNGYDTVIGESGATLSGGEKQRISIARAILKDTPIIILDEATSSVDPENEAELQQAIEKLTEDKTVIIIAHRLKTVRNAQQIVVIANGGIAQRGTHQELMTQPGIYADFVNIREKAVNWKISSSKIQQ